MWAGSWNKAISYLVATHLHVRLRVKIKAKSTGVCCVLRGGWIIERGNLLCVGYVSTRGCVSNLRLRVPVFVVFLVFFS